MARNRQIESDPNAEDLAQVPTPPATGGADIPPPSRAATWPKRRVSESHAVNPLLEHARVALESGGEPYELPAPDQKTGKRYETYLRDAAKELGAHARVFVRQQEDNSWIVFYKVLPGLSERTRMSRYTTADIRVWADTNGYSIPAEGKIPSEIRQAFRDAMGYSK